MSSKVLYINVRHAVQNSKNGDIGRLREELQSAKEGLNFDDSAIVTDLVSLIEGLKDDKGQIIEIIKILIKIVDTIEGKNQGVYKKQLALDLFTAIIDLIGVSQRDRKFYIAIFDNAVDLAFWGRDWFQTGGWDRIKRFFTSCGCI